MLRQAFEAFQMNVGLEGNILRGTSLNLANSLKTVGSKRHGNCVTGLKFQSSYMNAMIFL